MLNFNESPAKQSSHGETGPSQQSAIQPPSTTLLHPSKTQRPLSYRRSGTGLLSKSFRRTEEPPPRKARSGGSDMSEDDLESNPVPDRRDPKARHASYVQQRQCC